MWKPRRYPWAVMYPLNEAKSLRFQKFYSVAIFLIMAMALFSSVSPALAAEGGLTLLTNETKVEIGNEVQKISFDKGQEGKFHTTTAVWDGSSWRPFFDGGRPLIEGSQFNLEPTTWSLLSNTTGVIRIDKNTDTQKLIARQSDNFVNPRCVAVVQNAGDA